MIYGPPNCNVLAVLVKKKMKMVIFNANVAWSVESLEQMLFICFILRGVARNENDQN